MQDFGNSFLAGIVEVIILIAIEVMLTVIPIIGWILSLFVTWLSFAVQAVISSKQATFGMRALDM